MTEEWDVRESNLEPNRGLWAIMRCALGAGLHCGNADPVCLLAVQRSVSARGCHRSPDLAAVEQAVVLC